MKKNLESIRIRGARQNNLKGFDLDLPIGRLIVVTGLSGTGKSSLVFETCHAEGQRRYVETFSPYARQFMEMLDRPDVDGIENARPSIAIQQRNTIKTSRSTVGTMTELTDYFKVWFCHKAALYDPETGKRIDDDNPQTIWRKALAEQSTQNGEGNPLTGRPGAEGRKALITFALTRPENFTWKEILQSLRSQGYTRAIVDGVPQRIDLPELRSIKDGRIFVVQDRVQLRDTPRHRNRFIESAKTALQFGSGELQIATESGSITGSFSEGYHSPDSGRRFRTPSPALFSFNSPLGACGKCRGFGRVIEIDYRLVIPDTSLSVADGAIRAFQGTVYSESQRDLMRAAQRAGLRTDIPYSKLSDRERAFVLDGESGYDKQEKHAPKRWYGVARFFKWLEGNTYKMHVRVFLSKYRSYSQCPACVGARLQPDALNWKWHRRTLPDLYRLPVRELLALLKRHHLDTGNHQANLAAEAILARLDYLDQVGLGYLTIDRTSRSLSGGEVERVNLTACLGTALVDTLFVLDEPSIGLHSRDIGRLVEILKRLTAQGNTVIVVEHDEAIMKAADKIIELGPRPGAAGGNLTFQGTVKGIQNDRRSITGAYLSGRLNIPLPKHRRSVSSRRNPADTIKFKGVSKHNIRNLGFRLPLKRFVCLSGVSGSGKSTLLKNVIYEGLQAQRGKPAEDPAQIKAIEGATQIEAIVLVDQLPASRTPRSNPALFTDAWDSIRVLYAKTGDAQAAGMTVANFSFNTGAGRCDHCHGLGHERVEMQFMADVYVPCPVCDGRRFLPEVLAIKFRDKSVAEILELTVTEGLEFFLDYPAIVSRLRVLEDVGLGYVTLGQPLNTLSGGESQRLKLVRYLTRVADGSDHTLILLDEPTTGLHRDDIGRLVGVINELIERGHSVVVIEHHLDVLKSADWIIEMGPEAGDAGGKIVFEGTPKSLARTRIAVNGKRILPPTGPYLAAALKASENGQGATTTGKGHAKSVRLRQNSTYSHSGNKEPLAAAESRSQYRQNRAIEVIGARQNNLKNLTVRIPHRKISVVTGISGSGKSSLAFDIIFAEGQRRFMESMSPYARQFVEQLPRPDVDRLTGIPPTVAIEQRVTRGTRKSTVATITEVAQYLRLLFARIGVQHSASTGDPLIALKPTALKRRMKDLLREQGRKRVPLLSLCAPVIRGRKGHHQPLATWAADRGYKTLRIDGEYVDVSSFSKLDRYREHDIEIVVDQIHPSRIVARERRGGTRGAFREVDKSLLEALELGKGACFLAAPDGRVIAWLSTRRTDPSTGESYPDLDPKHFSWNSVRGWCPTCRGHGQIFNWMAAHDDYPEIDPSNLLKGPCPSCSGSRLNSVSRAVRLHLRDGSTANLPDLINGTPGELLAKLKRLKLDARGKAITAEVIPEIEERLKFMTTVGLDYLTLDRATATLSGGEAQRIRLSAQLGSNLSGVLYVLDEPSIGLHARDNARLLDSLHYLREKGNTLLIVEHDEDTMRRADRIIDLGPGAGIHGGEVLAEGTLKAIRRNRNSITGIYLKNGISHPRRGAYRDLPTPRPPAVVKASRSSGKNPGPSWIIAEKVRLRNLKGDDCILPKNRLIMVCGISGSGKSTLIRDLLKPAVTYASQEKIAVLEGAMLASRGFYQGERESTPPLRRLINGDGFRQVIEVDQNPIGKTPRSTPATYISAFDIIRQVFGSLPEARMHGYTASTFSFNTKSGRCETCKGAGRIKLAMSFMPDTYIDCEECGGFRYGSELKDVLWKGKNIAEVLAMTFEEAARFFSFHSRLKEILGLMVETGLGYLTLGQSSPTLSGGEAQRLKLVSELAKGLQSFRERRHGVIRPNLYILEEPTIGLHLSDCEKLIDVLHRLVDQGHTVIVIEHHLDLIAEADYVVEIGPEGGDAGGEILYQGDLAGLIKCRRSRTAPFLRKILER